MAKAFEFKAGEAYQLVRGHRRPGHKLFFLCEKPNVKYPDGNFGPGYVFACGTRREIEKREHITIVEVPQAVAKFRKSNLTGINTLSCVPNQFKAIEYPAYARELYDPARKEELDPIEAMLIKAGIENKSTPPTPYRTLADALGPQIRTPTSNPTPGA
jgi:hypothetical protein